MDQSSGWGGFPRGTTVTATTGWNPGCDHGLEPVADVVLDPFAGSGTVGLVADRLGRDFIGVELNPDYAAIAQRRLTGDAPLFAEVTVDVSAREPFPSPGHASEQPEAVTSLTPSSREGTES
jgi:hypothetical protein